MAYNWDDPPRSVPTSDFKLVTSVVVSTGKKNPESPYTNSIDFHRNLRIESLRKHVHLYQLHLSIFIIKFTLQFTLRIHVSYRLFFEVSMETNKANFTNCFINPWDLKIHKMMHQPG